MSVLLQTTTDRWVEVIKENDADFELITEKDQQQWLKFKDEVTVKLKEIVKNYSGGELTESETDWLRNLNSTFDRAKRVQRETLVKQKEERDEAERQRIEEERRIKEEEERRQAEVAALKNDLLSKLDF